MNVMYSSYELLEVFTCRLFFKFLIFDYEFEEFATARKLHHKIKILVRLDDLVDLNDVGMVQLLENFYLSTYPFDVLFVFDFRLF